MNMDFNHFNNKDNTCVPNYDGGDLPNGDAYNLSSLKKCKNAKIGPQNQFTINSSNVHIAPLPDMDLKRPFATRRRYLMAGSFFLLLSMIVLFLIIDVVVLRPEEKINQNENNSSPTTQPNVTSPEVPHEKTDATTSTTDSGVTPDDQPAVDWFVTNEQWGGTVPPEVKCAKNVLSDIIKVDNLKIGSCNSKEECIKVIKGEKILDSNFLIGNDGHVYENRGWNCLSNNNEDIDDLNHSIKISFIGEYTEKKLTELQKQLFHLLIQDGIKEIVLREKNYMLFRTCEGTDLEIISFLRRESHYHKDPCLR